MKSRLGFLLSLAAVAFVAFFALPALAQEIDPSALVQSVPAKYQVAALSGMFGLYALCVILRAFTSPTSTVGKAVRLVLDGVKHPDEKIRPGGPPVQDKAAALDALVSDILSAAPPAAAKSTPSAAPKGFGVVRLMLALALVAGLAAAFVPRVARAEDALAPRFGACWGTRCIGPRVAAPSMSVDLKSGDVQFNVIPGFGYGFEQTGTKVQWGVGAFVAVRETAAGPRACPSAMFDVFQYLHAGVLWQPGHAGGRAYGLLALGTDLGVNPPAVANATPAK